MPTLRLALLPEPAQPQGPEEFAQMKDAKASPFFRSSRSNPINLAFSSRQLLVARPQETLSFVVD